MPVTSRRSGIDERRALLPPELLSLFDDRFVRSCDLIEAYVARLALGIVRTLALDRACREPVTVVQAVRRAGLAADVALVPVGWLLATLATHGWIEREGDCYRALPNLPALDPQAIADEQAAHDPTALASYRIARLAAENYPAVLRGERTGEDALFAPERLSAWSEYFSNVNPPYAINNLIAARVAAARLPHEGARLLEIGGGLGSGAEAVLDRLAARERLRALVDYRFTDVSPQFLRRAKKSLVARYPDTALTFAWLDIDRPLDRAAVPVNGFDVVYGINVLHVARDLGATLTQLHDALAPRGVLVIGECLRPFPGWPVYVELVFNLLASFRAPTLHPDWRPNGGFLTPEQWIAALEATGFADVQITPDVVRLRDHYPSFVVGAIAARRA